MGGWMIPLSSINGPLQSNVKEVWVVRKYMIGSVCCFNYSGVNLDFIERDVKRILKFDRAVSTNNIDK